MLLPDGGNHVDGYNAQLRRLQTMLAGIVNHSAPHEPITQARTCTVHPGRALEEYCGKWKQVDMTAILNIARHHYPNLRVAYLSSRTFGGWSGSATGSPEPYAYEAGFGTRWVVHSQIHGAPQLNYDPARGEVKAPLVIWGPYLWACGDTPREFDGLLWSEDDVTPRCRRKRPTVRESAPVSSLAGVDDLITIIEAITSNPDLDSSFIMMESFGISMTVKKR
jgi:hypothetical protein